MGVFYCACPTAFDDWLDICPTASSDWPRKAYIKASCPISCSDLASSLRKPCYQANRLQRLAAESINQSLVPNRSAGFGLKPSKTLQSGQPPPTIGRRRHKSRSHAQSAARTWPQVFENLAICPTASAHWPRKVYIKVSCPISCSDLASSLRKPCNQANRLRRLAAESINQGLVPNQPPGLGFKPSKTLQSGQPPSTIGRGSAISRSRAQSVCRIWPQAFENLAIRPTASAHWPRKA